MPAAHTGTLAWHDLSERGKVAAQGIGIFVVDFADVDLAKVALVNHFLCTRWLHRILKSLGQLYSQRLDGMNNSLKRNVFDTDFLVADTLVPT